MRNPSVGLVLLSMSVWIVVIADSNSGESAINQTLPDFGALCNLTAGCKVNASLVCDPVQNVCKCLKPEDMVFDRMERKCLTYAERKCRYIIIDAGIRESDETNQNESTAREETMHCVTGAVCSPAGYCQCKLGYVDSRYTYRYPQSTDNPRCYQSGRHGHSCDTQLHCDATKYLACINHTCTCFAKAGMEWIQSTGKCEIMPGYSCRNLHEQYGNSTPSIPIFKDNQSAKHRDFYGGKAGVWRQIMETYSTAQCSNGTSCSGETGLCTCADGLVIDPINGNCALKRLDAVCSSNKECNSTQLLICIGGKCDCDPEYAVRNMEAFITSWRDNSLMGYSLTEWKSNISTGQCLAKVGVNCSIIRISGGMSRTVATTPGSIHCVDEAECNFPDKTCKCLNGRGSIKHGTTCGRAHGELCSGTKVCQDRFECKSTSGSNGMACRCPNTDYEIYDPTLKPQDGAGGGSGICRRLVGAACNPAQSGINPCVQNAECIEISENYTYSTPEFKCQCRNGFVENCGRQCDIEFGQPCGGNETASPSEVCDKMAGLECRLIYSKNFKRELPICSCPNLDDIYDAKERKCEKLGGVSTSRVRDKCSMQDDRERRRCGSLG